MFGSKAPKSRKKNHMLVRDESKGSPNKPKANCPAKNALNMAAGKLSNSFFELNVIAADTIKATINNVPIMPN